MRFIGLATTEGIPDQRGARHVGRKGAGEAAGEREQHRPAGERHRGVTEADRAPAGIDDERIRGEQRLDLVEPERPLVPPDAEARRRRASSCRTASTSAASEAMPRLPRRGRRSLERPAAPLRPAVGGWRGRRRRDRWAARQAGGSGSGSRAASARPASSRWPISSIRRAASKSGHGLELMRSPCASEHGAGRRERLGRPAEITRDEGDLGLGDGATRPRPRLARAEGAAGPLQEVLGAHEIAELRHRDAAQRQRRRILAEAPPASARRGRRPRPAPAPRPVISESIAIPPNLSLPPGRPPAHPPSR